jgi:hypothetical protein
MGILGEEYKPALPITSKINDSGMILRSDEVYRGVETYNESVDINNIEKVWEKYKDIRR